MSKVLAVYFITVRAAAKLAESMNSLIRNISDLEIIAKYNYN